MGRTVLKLETKGFAQYGEKLDRLGADLKAIFTDALEQAGETIGEDTLDAVTEGNLPAGGKYSTGDTEASVVRSPRVEWEGTTGSIGVGFDFGKPGAGGFLITGTPKMRPDKALNQMYKGKRYMKKIQQDMVDVFNDEIQRRMEG